MKKTTSTFRSIYSPLNAYIHHTRVRLEDDMMKWFETDNAVKNPEQLNVIKEEAYRTLNSLQKDLIFRITPPHKSLESTECLNAVRALYQEHDPTYTVTLIPEDAEPLRAALSLPENQDYTEALDWLNKQMARGVSSLYSMKNK